MIVCRDSAGACAIMDDIVTVNVRACDNITTAHGISSSNMLINNSINMTRICIVIFHHPSRTMNDAKVISEKYL